MLVRDSRRHRSQEDEASVLVIKLVDEVLVGDSKLLEIRIERQLAFRIAVAPYFVVSHSGKTRLSSPAAFISLSAGGSWLNTSLFTVSSTSCLWFVALLGPPN